MMNRMTTHCSRVVETWSPSFCLAFQLFSFLSSNLLNLLSWFVALRWHWLYLNLCAFSTELAIIVSFCYLGYLFPGCGGVSLVGLYSYPLLSLFLPLFLWHTTELGKY